jgi:beta-lactamase class A
MALNFSAKHQSNPKLRRKKTSQRVKKSDRPVPLSIHFVRLVICGLGASAIAGTILSVVNSPKQPMATQVEPPLPLTKPLPIDILRLTQSIPKLNHQLQAATRQDKGLADKKNSKLDPSYLFVEIDSGEYSELEADRVLPAASTIKLPILIALFQDVDAQKVQLTEKLTINKPAIAKGSKDLPVQTSGTQMSILLAASKMMTSSDNAATNLLIDRLGGAAALNQRFRNWGLKVTKIDRPLPDLEGKNVTTAKELARSIMAIVGVDVGVGKASASAEASPLENRGKIVSDASRSQILSMMSDTILPKSLGSGAKIARTTGNLASLTADVGLIELPTGKKYITAILIKHPQNDTAASELVQQMSKIVYTHFQHPSPNTVFIKKK